jgi:hypothetical protein
MENNVSIKQKGDFNMTKVLKRILTLAFASLMVFSTGITTYAAAIKDSNVDVRELLDSLENTQIIQISEYELLTNMVKANQISNEDLNNELYEMSALKEEELLNRGFSDSQIELIKNYDGTTDALMYTAAASSTLTFEYGLAGTGTRKQVKIAYHITWSSCPFWTFTDSFGIGWIAADSSSRELVTETVSAIGEVGYYTVDGSTKTGSRSISMKTNSNGVVTGNPIIGSAGGSYGKVISGVIDVKTQSGSYNMQTLQIFVAYAHTTVSVEIGVGVTLTWNKVNGAITFKPTSKQTMMVQDYHNFTYNSQDVIVAD